MVETSCLTLAEVNGMSDLGFVDAFGDVADHAPWVAEYALGIRPFLDREAMITAFLDGINQARADAQEELIRAHPPLAARAASAGAVMEDPVREQSGAGPDRPSGEDFSRFTELNERYRAKFGFPFIMAGKDLPRTTILRALERRLSNSRQVEFSTALEQVGRNARSRIEDRVRAGEARNPFPR